MSFSMENKKIINATPTNYDGIEFRSKLERDCAKYLDSVNIPYYYEPFSVVIFSKRDNNVPYYYSGIRTRHQVVFKERQTLRDITYTPDFVLYTQNYCILVEVKPIENDVYPYKRKLLLNHLHKLNNNLGNSNKLCIFAQISSVKALRQFIDLFKQKYGEDFIQCKNNKNGWNFVL